MEAFQGSHQIESGGFWPHIAILRSRTWGCLWATSYLSATLNSVGILAHLCLVPGDSIGEPIIQLLHDLQGRDEVL